MDKTYMKDQYYITILSIVILDGNNQIIPLSWAIIPIKDYKNWRWFPRQVERYIPLDKKDLMIMRGCGKELVIAINKIYL